MFHCLSVGSTLELCADNGYFIVSLLGAKTIDMKNEILTEIRQALADSVDTKRIEQCRRVFKGEVKMYGVMVPAVHRIGSVAFEQIKHLPKAEIFGLCEQLWRSGYSEEGHIAADWSYAVRKKYERGDFATFERWVHSYISNWATCDALCNHTVGEFLMKFPEYVAELKRWARSGNRWVKRAAAVSLIVPGRYGMFLEDALEIADMLLTDPDDMVQKGYGWMLKAVSMSEESAAAKRADPELRREHIETVFDFVMERREVMPRTAFRYAIEKMPARMRAQAMRK